MADQRGRCPDCRNQHPLRKDGTMGAHVAKPVKGFPAVRCAGTGKIPVPLIFDEKYGLPDCPECAMYSFAPGLGEAIYSVSIETGGSPNQMLRNLLTEYHVNGHKESDDA